MAEEETIIVKKNAIQVPTILIKRDGTQMPFAVYKLRLVFDQLQLDDVIQAKVINTLLGKLNQSVVTAENVYREVVVSLNELGLNQQAIKYVQGHKELQKKVAASN